MSEAAAACRVPAGTRSNVAPMWRYIPARVLSKLMPNTSFNNDSRCSYLAVRLRPFTRLCYVLQRVVEVEDGEEAPPIMEIREWIDESGKQTSVDVTDLGKV